MKITYIEKRFAAKTQKLIQLADNIIAEYAAQGFDLTLRQLYYQLVARGFIPNRQKEYKKLVKTISDARMAGLISWTAIVDRTRNLASNPHWDKPASVIDAARYSFALDKWDNQRYRPEVWIEKDALRGVISGVCNGLDVPHFSCRGYNSQSEMWRAAQRMDRHIIKGQIPYIIHLADHDPSGLDMSRDIWDRFEQFGAGIKGKDFHVKRVALNHSQVEQYQPPPNPAKLTDSRIDGYSEKYGFESWELDALEPTVIAEIITAEIDQIRDLEKWLQKQRLESGYLEELEKLVDNYEQVQELLRGNDLG
jgi:hypothetical protein